MVFSHLLTRKFHSLLTIGNYAAFLMVKSLFVILYLIILEISWLSFLRKTILLRFMSYLFLKKKLLNLILANSKNTLMNIF